MLKIYFQTWEHLRRFRGSLEKDRGEDKMENARDVRRWVREQQATAARPPQKSNLERKDGCWGLEK